MRKLLLLTPMIALSACSLFDPAPQHRATHSGFGQYNGCMQAPCAVQPQRLGQQQFQGQQFQAQQFQAPVNVMGNIGGHAQGHSGVHAQGHAPRHFGAQPYARNTSHANHATPPRLRTRKAGYAYGTIGAVKYEDAFDSYGLEGRLGYHTGRIIGAELEGSIGLLDEKDDSGTINFSSGYDYNIAAFAMARLPIGQRLSLHARGGYDVRSFTSAAVQDNNAGNAAKVKANLDGLAYGVGGEYALNRRDGLRVDFTRYESQGRDADSVSVSYTRKF